MEGILGRAHSPYTASGVRIEMIMSTLLSNFSVYTAQLYKIYCIKTKSSMGSGTRLELGGKQCRGGGSGGERRRPRGGRMWGGMFSPQSDRGL